MRAIVAISSSVVRGHVGNSAAAFALQRLGFPVWAMPTVILPWHPGHGPAHRTPIATADLGAMLDEIAASRFAGEIGAIISGYLAEPAQAAAIARFVAAIRGRNDGVLYCCDPILGDDGRLYVDAAVAAAVRDELVPLADILTPNLFELSWLAGTALPDNEAVLAVAATLGAAETLVTSAHPLTRGGIATLLVGPHAALIAETRRLAGAPHGTGDLMTALFLAHRLNRARPEDALAHACASLYALIDRTVRAGRDEFALAEHQDALLRAGAPVRLHRLGAPRRGY